LAPSVGGLTGSSGFLPWSIQPARWSSGRFRRPAPTTRPPSRSSSSCRTWSRLRQRRKPRPTPMRRLRHRLRRSATAARLAPAAHVAEQVRKVMRARRVLAQKLNREPVLDEIAKESGFPPERVRELFELVEDPVSLDTPVGDGESLYGDLIEDTKLARPDITTADNLRSVELAEALAALNPRMRLVLARRFGLDGAAPQTLE